jgi:outer membrane murein-binding lipoprotein Lpp
MMFTHLLQSAPLIPTDASALQSAISALERAISALEVDIKALDNRSVPWEHALPWFTLAVLVGVAMELGVIWYDFREESETWAIFHFIAVLRSPSRPSVRKFALEIVGVALVVLGIVGEFGFGVEIASINSLLRSKSDQLRSKNADLRSKSEQLLALVTRQAGDAATSAQTAHAEANTVQTEARAIKLQLDTVAKHAEALGFQLDFQGARAELFNRKAGIFVEKVKPFSGQKVEIRTNLSEILDPENRQEASRLAAQLNFFMGQVTGWIVSTGEGGHDRGVRVIVSRKALRETREAASALASGLGDVGLTGPQRQKPEVEEAQEGSEIDRTNFVPDTILLFVGRHP